MFKFEFYLSGVNRISQLAPHIRANMAIGFDAALQQITDDSRKNYLTGPRPGKLGVITGRLRSSIGHLVEKVGSEGSNIFAQGVVFAQNVKYARIHELGGPNGPIRAKNVPFLHFFWKKEQRWVRTKEVRGTVFPPRPFLKPAISEVLIWRFMQHAIDMGYSETLMGKIMRVV